MNIKTIKYPAGRGIRVYFWSVVGADGKSRLVPKQQKIEHGPIWRFWCPQDPGSPGNSPGWVSTY